MAVKYEVMYDFDGFMGPVGGAFGNRQLADAFFQKIINEHGGKDGFKIHIGTEGSYAERLSGDGDQGGTVSSDDEGEELNTAFGVVMGKVDQSEAQLGDDVRGTIEEAFDAIDGLED